MTTTLPAPGDRVAFTDAQGQEHEGLLTTIADLRHRKWAYIAVEGDNYLHVVPIDEATLTERTLRVLDGREWKYLYRADEATIDGRTYVNIRRLEETEAYLEDAQREIGECLATLDRIDDQIVRIETGMAERAEADTQPVSISETVDALLITGALRADLLEQEGSPIRATVACWTQAQREEATWWAAAVHVHASDHDDVVVPPTPAHVAPLLARFE